MFIADLHIHSAYSRATSKSSEPVSLDRVARQKGLQLIGSGDFTHPAYRSELREKLIPAEDGLYTLRPELAQPLSGALSAVPPCRFLISGEISCIYKKNGRVRKVHHVILLPSIDAADRLSSALERIGNLHSDGRPILGLDSRDLLEITLDSCPEAVFIPAHIWTPHFSLFGAYSGFDTIEECFEDLTGHVHALETGLSSDPLMNFQCSALDKYTLVSNSDCHSPEKLAREANIFDCELSFPALSRALADRKGDAFAGTIEFFPEEGKYHYDGHRDCHVCTSPAETGELNGICPVCGRRLTLGVAGRVAQLADRPYGFIPVDARPFERLIPLPEVIAACNGLASATSVKVKKLYGEMLQQLGPELTVLRSLPYEEIEATAGACVTEGIRRIREGRVEWQPGHDGEYGRCTILSQEDMDRLSGQTFLFGGFVADPKSADNKADRPAPASAASGTEPAENGDASDNPYGLSDEQWAAVVAEEPEIAVIAGPGSGKTRTLISRIAYLIERKHTPPEQITAVTFTNKAANELKQRLSDHFSDQKTTARMNVGTFHSLALAQLRRSGIDITLLDQEESAELQKEAEAEAGAAEAGLIYQQKLDSLQATDFDGLLTLALAESQKEHADLSRFTHLLVDEFQDANPIQYDMVKTWHGQGPARSLFVIGDPDQSIYGFRGADSACFERLQQDYPQLAMRKLGRNYRSAGRIVAASVPVIEEDGHRRQLSAARKDEGRIARYNAESAFNEAVFIAHEIDSLVGGVDMIAAHRRQNDKTRGLSDIAVLARTHRQLELIEQCLIEQGVPCIVAGRGSFLNDGAVRDCLAFFRFLLTPADGAALRRSLRSFECQTESIIRLQSRFRDSERKSVADLKKLAKKLKIDEADEFCSLAEALAPKVRRDKPEKLLRAYSAARFLEGNAALEQLIQAAPYYDKAFDLVEAAVSGQEIDIRRSAGGYRKDAVLLTTLHGAKGLEFPVVFLAGLQDGLLPLHTAKTVDTDEERRLCYVGMTRAEDELYLCTESPESPFLLRIPEDLVETVSPKRKYRQSGKQLTLFT